MKSNEIGKFIYNKLITNTDLFNLVGDKIFPLIAENGTEYPYVIYSRSGGGNTTYTKDGLTLENCTITIDCVHPDYGKGVEVAIAVREVLDNLCEIPVMFQLTSTTESWDDEGIFIQTLNYDIDIRV